MPSSRLFFSLGLIEAHNQFKATLDDANSEFKAIIRLVEEARQICHENNLEITSNPYTNIESDVSYL